MKITLQAKWEAEWIADILASNAAAYPESKSSKWAKDCADRIRRQVEDARKAAIAKAAKCCANCGTPVLLCPAGEGQKDVSVCGAWTRAKWAKEGEE